MRKFFEVRAVFFWPAVVLGIHFLATYTGAYWKFLKLDNVMHFLGGASIGAASITFFALARSRGWLGKTSPWLTILLAAALTGFIAVCWEFMEYFMGVAFGIQMQPDLTDTMSDLALGITGGSLVALLRTIYRK